MSQQEALSFSSLPPETLGNIAKFLDTQSICAWSQAQKSTQSIRSGPEALSITTLQGIIYNSSIERYILSEEFCLEAVSAIKIAFLQLDADTARQCLHIMKCNIGRDKNDFNNGTELRPEAQFILNIMKFCIYNLQNKDFHDCNHNIVVNMQLLPSQDSFKGFTDHLKNVTDDKARAALLQETAKSAPAREIFTDPMTASLLVEIYGNANREVVNILLHYGVSSTSPSYYKHTPAEAAIEMNHPELLPILHHYGGLDGDIGRKCWKLAIDRDNAETLCILRDTIGVNIDLEEGCSPLHYATKQWAIKAVEILAPISDVDKVDQENRTPIELALEASNPERIKMLEALIRAGVDLDIKLSDGAPLILRLIEDGYLDLAERAIDKGMDVNVEHDGTNLLQFAVEFAPDSISLIAKIIQNGDYDLNNFALLLQVIDSNVTALIELLVREGADLDREFDDGQGNSYNMLEYVSNTDNSDTENFVYNLHDKCLGERLAEFLDSF